MNWLTVHISKFDRADNRLQMIQQLIAEPSDQSVRYLVSFLKDKEPAVRNGAIDALGQLRASQAVKDLIPMLQDPEMKVRETAVGALAQIGDRSCIDALIPVLGDDRFEVRRRAARAMDSFNWRPACDEHRLLWAIARGDYEAAAREGGELAVEPLIILLREKSSPDRRLIAQALGKTSDLRATHALCDILSDTDSHVRVAAAETLGDLGDSSAIEPLVVALQDSEHLVRAAAANALRKIGDPNAIDGLVTVLNDSNWDVRRAGVEALGQIRDKRGVPPLLVLLKDKDADVRLAAVKSLGQIGDQSATAALIAALVDLQITVRQSANDALKNVDGNWELSPAAQDAIPLLQAAMESKEYWVRCAATETLDRIAKARKSGSTTTMIAAPVFQRQTSALEALLNSLTDWDRDLRQAAAEALGRLADPRAFEPLTARLHDDDPAVRASALQALQAMGWKPSGNTTYFTRR